MMYEQWNAYVFILLAYGIAFATLLGYMIFCWLVSQRLNSYGTQKVDHDPT
ncbi:MAG: hypothetical protein OXC40_03080 [Proteobacteria bacterium]|nr:hypothetical protein [Pseudomonadota bacterium]